MLVTGLFIFFNFVNCDLRDMINVSALNKKWRIVNMSFRPQKTGLYARKTLKFLIEPPIEARRSFLWILALKNWALPQRNDINSE